MDTFLSTAVDNALSGDHSVRCIVWPVGENGMGGQMFSPPLEWDYIAGMQLVRAGWWVGGTFLAPAGDSREQCLVKCPLCSYCSAPCETMLLLDTVCSAGWDLWSLFMPPRVP